MRRAVMILVVAAILLLLGGCGSGTQDASGTAPAQTGETAKTGEEKEKETVKLGITQIVEHPALDSIRKGILDALNTKGFHLDVDYKSAQNDQSATVSIAQNFAADKKDLIIAISTPSAQAAVQATSEIPVQFVAVTDPVAAGLVAALDKPGKNVTGTSDQVPMDKMFEMIKMFMPDVKKIGIVYNSGEVNSEVQVKAFKEAAEKGKVEVVAVGVTQPTEVGQGTESLAGKVDALFVTVDNLVVSSFDALLTVAKKSNIPVFASDIDTVKRGAVATYGIDYYKFGYQSGEMAARILNGEDIRSIPVEVSKDVDLYINMKAARDFKIDVSEEVKQKAKELYE